MTRQEIFDRLDVLTTSYSFIFILARIVLRDFCGPIDILFSKNTREHLNYNEFALLVGLWIKNVDINKTFDKEVEKEIFDEIYFLMEELHHTFIAEFKLDIDNLPDFYEHFSQGPLLQETMFYGGTGAYDEQYLEFVIEKYKYDSSWLKTNKDFDLKYLPEFYKSIKSTLQKKLNVERKRSNLTEREQMLAIFCLTKEEIVKQRIDFESLLSSFSTDISKSSNSAFKDIGDFNSFSERPIIKLPNDQYFIPSSFALSEALYESPYYWMIKDQTYSSKAFFNRGKVAEEITKQIISSVFDQNDLYQNVIINKTKNDQVTDIDLLAIFNRKGLIFQVKSKKLTTLSKQGNTESIKNDFKKAVQEAYDQAIISKACLSDHNNFKFSINDNDFIERIKNVEEYLIVTILLDDYPAITHQVHVLLGNKSEELPVAINIFDLALLAKYLKNPSQFIDYISRRIKYSTYFKADNEMAYLGFHLKKGLKKYEGDMIYLDESWAQSIDKKFYHELYDQRIAQALTKKIHRNDPCFCQSGIKFKKCHGKI